MMIKKGVLPTIRTRIMITPAIRHKRIFISYHQHPSEFRKLKNILHHRKDWRINFFLFFFFFFFPFCFLGYYTFHHICFRTRFAQRLNPWADTAKLSVFDSRESNLSPRSATLLILSFIMPTYRQLLYSLHTPKPNMLKDERKKLCKMEKRRYSIINLLLDCRGFWTCGGFFRTPSRDVWIIWFVGHYSLAVCSEWRK